MAEVEMFGFLTIERGTCLFSPVGAIKLDCRVDLRDFALMAGNWLVDCILEPSDPACQEP